MMKKKQFIQTVFDHYLTHKRDLPWRRTQNPYNILISEVMLQQTRVERVIPKYERWISLFPDLEHLRRTPLHTILKEWQGLGYNRRALYLKKTSEILRNSSLPKREEELTSLPGIGPYTARAIQTFAYNIPTILIETNIRTAYIHHFFKNKKEVRDSDIEPIVKKTLNRANPREWYWALMDYGSYVKKTIGNEGRKSRHYVKQSRFQGSNREVRSHILSLVLKEKKTTTAGLKKTLHEERIDANLNALLKEGFLEKRGKNIVVRK